MEFENTFTVDAPIADVWAAMLDLERVAPCVPGARVLGSKGDDAYDVGIKIKLGPVVQQYRGEVLIADRDASSYEARMRARAKEARGQGTADADVSMRLEETPEGTRGTIHSTMALTGKAASMGSGIIQDVARRITDQFARNLADMLSAPEAAAEQPAPAPGPDEPGAPPPPPRPAAAATSGDDDAMPVLPLVGAMVSDRMRDTRVLGASMLLMLLLGWLLGRRSAR